MRTFHTQAVMLLLASITGALAGCKVGPNFHAPHEDVPAQFSATQSGTGEPVLAPESQPVQFW